MVPVDSKQNLATSLHPWIVSNPIQEASRLEKSALAWNVLSKIAYVAIAAICAAVLAVSLVFGTVTGTLPYVLLGLVFTTPFLSIAASKLQAKSKEIGQQAAIERAAADRFQYIQYWEEPQIKEFLDSHSIVPQPHVPIRTLLPLIARFEAKKSEANIAKLASDQLLQSSDIPIRTIRLQHRVIGWNILEQEALPAALEAALMLQILSQPFSQLRLSDIGEIEQKTFEERQADRKFGPRDHCPDDDYFIFKERNRQVLTLREIVDDLSPDALREKLFPREIALV